MAIEVATASTNTSYDNSADSLALDSATAVDLPAPEPIDPPDPAGPLSLTHAQRTRFLDLMGQWYEVDKGGEPTHTKPAFSMASELVEILMVGDDDLTDAIKTYNDHQPESRELDLQYVTYDDVQMLRDTGHYKPMFSPAALLKEASDLHVTAHRALQETRKAYAAGNEAAGDAQLAAFDAAHTKLWNLQEGYARRVLQGFSLAYGMAEAAWTVGAGLLVITATKGRLPEGGLAPISLTTFLKAVMAGTATGAIGAPIKQAGNKLADDAAGLRIATSQYVRNTFADIATAAQISVAFAGSTAAAQNLAVRARLPDAAPWIRASQTVLGMGGVGLTVGLTSETGNQHLNEVPHAIRADGSPAPQFSWWAVGAAGVFGAGGSMVGASIARAAVPTLRGIAIEDLEHAVDQLLGLGQNLTVNLGEGRDPLDVQGNVSGIATTLGLRQGGTAVHSHDLRNERPLPIVIKEPQADGDTAAPPLTIAPKTAQPDPAEAQADQPAGPNGHGPLTRVQRAELAHQELSHALQQHKDVTATNSASWIAADNAAGRALGNLRTVIKEIKEHKPSEMTAALRNADGLITQLSLFGDMQARATQRGLLLNDGPSPSRSGVRGVSHRTLAALVEAAMSPLGSIDKHGAPNVEHLTTVLEGVIDDATKVYGHKMTQQQLDNYALKTVLTDVFYKGRSPEDLRSAHTAPMTDGKGRSIGNTGGQVLDHAVLSHPAYATDPPMAGNLLHGVPAFDPVREVVLRAGGTEQLARSVYRDVLGHHMTGFIADGFAKADIRVDFGALVRDGVLTAQQARSLKNLHEAAIRVYGTWRSDMAAKCMENGAMSFADRKRFAEAANAKGPNGEPSLVDAINQLPEDIRWQLLNDDKRQFTVVGIPKWYQIVATFRGVVTMQDLVNNLSKGPVQNYYEQAIATGGGHEFMKSSQTALARIGLVHTPGTREVGSRFREVLPADGDAFKRFANHLKSDDWLKKQYQVDNRLGSVDEVDLVKPEKFVAWFRNQPHDAVVLQRLSNRAMAGE